MTQANSRTAEHPIDPLFLERWSPRAFTDETISERDLLTLLEAARWAPSSFNSQPWRFLYARRDTAHWPQFLGLLNEYNQSWAKKAAALVILVSKTTLLPRGADKEVPSYTHSLDAGAAWANLALQATRSGWAAHGMAGFDVPRTAAELGVPPYYRVEAAIAIGRPGDKSLLPESLRAREQPSDRLALSQLAMEGRFFAEGRSS
jgi:nitroreductase